MNTDLTEEVKRLKCRLKIIHGLKDLIMPFENCVDFKKQLGG
jgi:hypothetical protein